MSCRERVRRVLRREPVDMPAVQYYYTDVGVHEHGEKLNELFAAHPGDFAPFVRMPPPALPEGALDADGRYYEVRTDAWGTTWEYRIYGRMGHAIGFPISDPSQYAAYRFPDLPAYCLDDAAFEAARAGVREEQRRYPALRGEGYAYLERLIALRGFENALVDLMEDGPEVNAFLDRLTEHYLVSIHRLIDMGVDCVPFGDDYGTQRSSILSVDLFQRAIMPRLRRLMDPLREAGIFIHFHSCGMVKALFPSFEALGVNAIWPQLPLYDMAELRDACARHGFALAIHTDRAETMTHGTPERVRALVRREADVFRPQDGGAWFYIEVDHGFPYENVVALVEEVYAIRAGR